MSDKPARSKTGSHWKRPPTKVYDYNYDVGQHYYKPMMRHLDKKSAGVSTEPPGPRSFAERIAEDPLYGRSRPVNYVTSDYTPSYRNNGLADTPSKRRSSLGDYLDDGSRAGRYNSPSISDQIMEGAGMKKPETFLDEALADLKKRRAASAEVDDLANDSFFTKASEEALTKRRNMLRDLDSDLEKIDSGLEKYSSSRKAAAAALAEASASSDLLSSSSHLSSSASSSVNVKKRSVRTTYTTETVRY